MFSEHKGIKLETSNQRKFRKFTNIWKLNNPLLNDNRSKKKSQGRF